MFISIIAVAVLSLLVAACGRKKEEVHPQVEGQGGKKYGGAYRMNILRGSPKGLDPVLINSKHADDIASQVFDRLIDLNDTLGLVPELARSLPKINANGTVFTFDLRTDVYFQDDSCFPGGKGRKMTAEDVRYSLTRCCDPRTQSVAYSFFKGKVKGATEYYDAIFDSTKNGRGKTLADIPGLRALNDSTFEIELTEPYAPFLYYLVNSLGDVIPHEGVAMYRENFFRHPVGTGPFSFVSWTPDQELVLKRNPKYWGKDQQGNRLPFLDEIHFKFIQDDKIQLNEFLSGHLDESFGIPTEHYTEVVDSLQKPKGSYAKYQLQSAPAMLTWFFDFNNQKAPFNNASVRKAFNYAIDREKIVRFALQNAPYAPAIHGLVPPVFPNYPTNDVKGYGYDPDQAKRLLAQAGFPDGKGFPTVTLHIYTDPRLGQVAQAVQAMLREVLNVNIEIQRLETPQLLDQAESGKLLFWGTRWYGDYPDPETYLILLNGELVPSDDAQPSYPNSSRYNNPEFVANFKKGVATIDHLAQMKHYADAENIAMADAPIMPLFYERHYRLLQPYVRDCPLDAMARYDLKYTWLDNAKR
ncbi:MAG: extracellular solute-binding protein family 5 [Chlorobi bacterium]|nr:extracellular solute-binding protein family 5 [Chlorobiota bacterium]